MVFLVRVNGFANPDNTQDGGPMQLSGKDPRLVSMVPVVSISQADGAQLAAAIKAGRTTLSLNSACCQSPFTVSISIYQSNFEVCLAAVLAYTAPKHPTSCNRFDLNLWF